LFLAVHSAPSRPGQLRAMAIGATVLSVWVQCMLVVTVAAPALLAITTDTCNMSTVSRKAVPFVPLVNFPMVKRIHVLLWFVWVLPMLVQPVLALVTRVLRVLSRMWPDSLQVVLSARRGPMPSLAVVPARLSTALPPCTRGPQGLASVPRVTMAQRSTSLAKSLAVWHAQVASGLNPGTATCVTALFADPPLSQAIQVSATVVRVTRVLSLT